MDQRIHEQDAHTAIRRSFFQQDILWDKYIQKKCDQDQRMPCTDHASELIKRQLSPRSQKN